MTNAHIAMQVAHIARAKYIAHHAFALVHAKSLTLIGRHARRVLPTVLQQQQRIINQLVHRAIRHHTNHATHLSPQIKIIKTLLKTACRAVFKIFIYLDPYFAAVFKRAFYWDCMDSTIKNEAVSTLTA
jgi:hypothetical protein